MKKIIALLLAVVMMLSLAACQPSTNQPTNAPTNAPTDPAPTDDIVIGGDPTTPKPTEPAATEPKPTDPPAPAVLADSGFCAVGILNAEAGTAKILADNGYIGEISYTSEEEIRTGMVYAFAKEGEVYKLSSIAWINGPNNAWATRTWDNNAAGVPDQLYTNDGVNETLYDLEENCVIFCRFSDTEYRIFRGSDAIKCSDFPCDCYFNGNVNPAGGNLTVSVMLVVDVDTNTWQDSHANESTTYFFDPEGFGWSDGDLIIE